MENGTVTSAASCVSLWKHLCDRLLHLLALQYRAPVSHKLRLKKGQKELGELNKNVTRRRAETSEIQISAGERDFPLSKTSRRV